MSDQSAPETVELLREIRDTLATAARNQDQMLGLLRQQAQHSRERVAESIELQKVSVARQRQALVGGLPLIVICLGLIGYLMWAYL